MSATLLSDKLKASLLQAAIQGKLTMQLPDDGDARDLLKQIEREKERLITEKVIKKEKPLPPITADEIPFDIPDNWVWVRLGGVLQLTSGQDLPPNDYNNTNIGIPYITGASNFQNNTLIINRWTNNPRSIAFKNDLLLTCKGTVGDMAFLSKNKAHIARQVMAISDRIHKLNLNYIKIVLSNQIAYLKSIAKSMIPGINRDDVLSCLIPLPPLAEQHRIVESIETALTKIDKLKADETKLYEIQKAFPHKLKASLLQSAIQGKLTTQLPEDGDARDLLKQIEREKERLIKEKVIKKEKPLPPITADEIPFDIPDNWVWVRLGNLANYRKGPFGSSLTKSMFVPKNTNTIKVYEQKNAIQKNDKLGEYYINNMYYLNKMTGFTLNGGDIIVSCAGTIGESYILPEEIELGIINQALMRVRCYSKIYKQFYLYIFDFAIRSPIAMENSKGSAIKNIPPFEILKKIIIPLPPLAEQHRIVEALEIALGKIDRLNSVTE